MIYLNSKFEYYEAIINIITSDHIGCFGYCCHCGNNFLRENQAKQGASERVQNKRD